MDRTPGDDVGVRFFSTDCDVLKRLTNFLKIQLFFCPVLWGGTLSQDTRKSRWSRVGTSKIILDFYPVICLVR
jgi:hypothetical protein